MDRSMEWMMDRSIYISEIDVCYVHIHPCFHCSRDVHHWPSVVNLFGVFEDEASKSRLQHFYKSIYWFLRVLVRKTFFDLFAVGLILLWRAHVYCWRPCPCPTLHISRTLSFSLIRVHKYTLTESIAIHYRMLYDLVWTIIFYFVHSIQFNLMFCR